jgi:hypothetical protein
MSKFALLWLCTCLLSMAACDEPEPRRDPARITVSTGLALESIAFRDGFDGEWQVPLRTSSDSYALEVHGPYVVSVVCAPGDGSIVTRQIARTPDDSRYLEMECTEATSRSATLTGKMAWPGTIGIDQAWASSGVSGWTFTLPTSPGTFDLLAFSDRLVSLRRNVAVYGTVDHGTIDLEQEGFLLEPVTLTASKNVSVIEQVGATVRLATPHLRHGHVYEGDPAGARVAPSQLLTAGVQQLVTVYASDGSNARAVRRDFRAGDPTLFTLPEPLEAVQLDGASGGPVATWRTLPEYDELRVLVHGTVSSGGRRHELVLSQRFVAATGATSAAPDTELPGYLPAWRPDYSRVHSADLLVQRERDGELHTWSVFKSFNAPVPQAARHGGFDRPAAVTAGPPAARMIRGQ